MSTELIQTYCLRSDTRRLDGRVVLGQLGFSATEIDALS